MVLSAFAASRTSNPASLMISAVDVRTKNSSSTIRITGGSTAKQVMKANVRDTSFLDRLAHIVDPFDADLEEVFEKMLLEASE
jgi:hypothetical protein